jgi:hypothetical protein
VVTLITATAWAPDVNMWKRKAIDAVVTTKTATMRCTRNIREFRALFWVIVEAPFFCFDERIAAHTYYGGGT